MWGEVDYTQVLLKETSLDVGHVFVMWLYSGTYQLVSREVEASPREALKTALGVYVLALKFNLHGLDSLARDHITRLGDQVGIYTTINVVLEVYPRKSKGDEWLNEFLSSRTKAALQEDPKSAVIPVDDVEPEDGTLIAKTVVRNVLGAYREKAEELAAREAALEEATLALAAQQLAFDNAVKATAPATPPGAVKPSEGSDYALAPEEVPSAFATAVVEELALSQPAAASPENSDWVVTSPREVEVEPEELVVSTKKIKKDKKGKKRISLVEPEPEPEPICEAEPELEPEPEPAVVYKSKKMKKMMKASKAEPEVVEEVHSMY